MGKTETGIDWDWVRKELDCTSWEEGEEGEEQRLCYLGSLINPSGKYYQPWACSNLDPCEACKGTGKARERVKRRLRKKWHNALERMRRRMIKSRRGGRAGIPTVVHVSRYASYCLPREHGPACEQCGGIGSREAYLDELWQEKLEEEASERGLFITGGEGDPCDTFAGECRDVEEGEEES